ncbi:MAG: M20/M25/M40 family metallo-hydrolase, partial [Synergistaceae bacterium]|nr:M20/M25/M40 family metallo-hydrolase [Synergistaceae bacterium]
GKTSHASEPEKGLNPAYVIGRLICEIESLRDEFRAKNILCTVINISLGEKNFGISPGEGELALTLRARSDSEMREIRNHVINIAEKLAVNDSFRIECTGSDYFPETSSEAFCVKRVRRAAESLGLKVIDMQEPIRASEDFGWYTKQIPGAIFYIGNGEDYPAIHTGKYDFNDDILATASDMFTGIYNDSVIK